MMFSGGIELFLDKLTLGPSSILPPFSSQSQQKVQYEYVVSVFEYVKNENDYTNHRNYLFWFYLSRHFEFAMAKAHSVNFISIMYTNQFYATKKT